MTSLLSTTSCFVEEDRLCEQIKTILHWTGLRIWTLNTVTGAFNIKPEFIEHRSKEDNAGIDTTQAWSSLIQPEDIASAILDLFRRQNKQTGLHSNTFRLWVNGQWVYFQVCGGVTERDQNGKPIQLSGTIQDITEIKNAEKMIQHRNRLLEAANDAIKLLLDTNDYDFDKQLWKALDILGKAATVDRVCVWKNSNEKNKKRCTAKIYEWSPTTKPVTAKSEQNDKFIEKLPYEETIPEWEKKLASGNCINGFVRLMSPEEQAQLYPRGIVSILVAPILFNDEFWGFIGFDDCHRERVWNELEIGVLKSVGMLIAAAIQRQMTNDALEKEEELLKMVFDSSPAGVMITTNGIVRCINRLCNKLLGLSIGDRIEKIYTDPKIRNIIIEEIKETGKPANHNISFHCTDGTIHDFMTTYQDINYNGEPSLLCWASDISDLKKTEKELLLAKDAAEVATYAKSEFLARMSHEIRTPMNAILGMTYLCLQTELTEKQHDYLVKTQTATINLLGIIDDILDFSKIEAGKIELENIPFRLSEVVDGVFDLLEFRAKEKGLKLKFNIERTIHNDLQGDPLRLRQILLNLANNAVKFTESGEICIEIKPVTESETDPDDNKIRLDFSVCDTGIGLTAEQIDRLFKSFSQADGSTTRKYGGTGLGLAISKNLVELMGGSIDVKSIPGKKTIFHFTAVFNKVNTTPDSTLTVDSSTSVEGDSTTIISSISKSVDLSHHRILVVDDDESVCEVIRDFAFPLHLYLETARSGQEALELLAQATAKHDPFEIVLLDWKMPQMNGIETIQRIRESTGTITPPQIVMISAYDLYECRRITQKLNLAGFLAKPIQRKTLQETLITVFEKTGTIIRKHNKSNILQGAKVLLVEDNKINQMVALELLKMLGIVVSIANNGVEAIDAVKAKDFDLILMDIQMPVMDGLSAAREIRKLKKSGVDKLPILAMSANAMDIDYHKSLEAGMNAHLTKPINPEKLRQSLEVWISRNQ
jgi:PAS domain S-box-containing protein